MPTQVKKTKQKASVEGTVGKVATAIIAELRNTRFLSLQHMEVEIKKALKKFNDSPFQKREGSRSIIFNDYEKEYLRELPLIKYEICDWAYQYKVALDFHVYSQNNTLITK